MSKRANDDVLGFAIRQVVASEIAQLHKIRMDAFADVFRSFRDIMGQDVAAIAMLGAEEEQAALLDGFATASDEKELLVGAFGDQLIGFAAISFDVQKLIGEIVLLAVDPAHSRQGHGTALNQAALRRMKDRGMRVATVGTGGDRSHAAARRAYEKSGFQKAIPNFIYYQSLDTLT